MKNKSRIIQIVIIIVSMILALMLYSTEYSIRNNPKDIEDGISEFLEMNIEVVKYEKVDNTIFVYFTDADRDKVGHTVLYRGLNYRFQIRTANFGSRNQVLSIHEFKTLWNRYWAVFGRNYDNRIDTIVFNSGKNPIKLEGIEGMSEILLIHESNNNSSGMERIYQYILFDEKGNNITEDMNNYLVTSDRSGFGRGKAELFMVNIFCGSIILVGVWISRMINVKCP